MACKLNEDVCYLLLQPCEVMTFLRLVGLNAALNCKIVNSQSTCWHTPVLLKFTTVAAEAMQASARMKSYLQQGITYPLSQQLQLINIDLVKATTDTKAVVAALERLCTEAQTSFPWSVAVQLAEHVRTVLSKPRVVGRQRQIHRPNADTESVEDHYRVNLHYSFFGSHSIANKRQIFPRICRRHTTVFVGIWPPPELALPGQWHTGCH